jgi:hypothetical protein
LDPRRRTSSPDRSIKCSGTLRAPRSKANPRHTNPLKPPGNHIPALFDQPALCDHPRRCAGAVREGRYHSMTLCCPLPYTSTLPPRKRTAAPSKGVRPPTPPHLGRRRDTRPMERIFSITSGPMQPSPPLCRHPGHCKAIPRTVGTQVDRTSPRPPLRSRRSSVSQALKLAYRRRSNKSSSATTLEAAPGRAQDPPRRLLEARFTRTVVNSMTLYAMLPHTVLRAMRHDCKPSPLAL